MSAESETPVSCYDRLCADYPELVTRFPECNEGWEGILRTFFSAVAETGVTAAQFRLQQIKEKWGDLVIYYYLDDSVSAENRDRIRAAHDVAIENSRMTCELTGKPGVAVERGGWYMVRSPEFVKPGDKVTAENVPVELQDALDKALAGELEA